MNIDVCAEVCRAVFDEYRWFLLERGTIFCTRVDVGDEYVLGAMKKLATAIGPYGGEGSEYGDCLPMKLKNFPGWLISYPAIKNVLTYVGPEEMEGTPPPSQTEKFLDANNKILRVSFDMRVALFGRYKRNLDARDPKIIMRSTDK